MHDDSFSRSDAADEGARNNDNISFNLGLDNRTWINDERIAREDLTLEKAADSDDAFKRKFPLELRALIKKRREPTIGDG